ncbi:MAG: GNAT family N-acetyltransferase [SAR324 cluster bacterium]|nr:GNAT family N-acetyltransferase [SAR324 cluster bacterium]
MKDLLHIRYANEHDAAVIAEFNRAMAKETENKILDISVVSAGVDNLMKNPEYGFYLVAEQHGQVTGCLMITTEWSDWRNGIFWWIQSVYISPEYRRRGVFSQMYTHIRNLANQQEDICGLRLYVENNNHAAQTTYHHLGMLKTNYGMFEEEF